MNEIKNIKERIERFNKFWNREQTERPTVGFQIGSPFVACRLEAGRKLLVENMPVTPDMLNVEEFIESYEKNYEISLQVEQDSFWTAEPYNGIPWLEGIAGCPIVGSKASFRSREYINDADDLDNIVLSEANPWYQKYFEFLEVLIKASKGRYPVGQPILRGISDLIGAVMGQEKLIYSLYDHPDSIKRFVERATDFFIKFIKKQEEMLPDFYGGYSIGFYNIWAREKSMWFQDDISCLFSPQLYREFIHRSNVQISKACKYNTIHLHPASFHLLNYWLGIEELKAIEVNRDVGGPSVKEMLPALKKIQESKPLIIRGIMDKEDIDTALNNLSYRGLHLYQLTETVDEAKFWMEYIVNNSKAQDD